MSRAANQIPRAAPSLTDLRRRIDAIDDTLHDLVMERSALAQEIGRLKSSVGDRSYMRPAREAVVLRRLVARHRGAFPRAALVRIWREIMSAALRLQGPFRVAVWAPQGEADLLGLARAHFGDQTPTVSCATAGAVLEQIGAEDGVVGVLPVPANGEVEPWWPALVGAAAGPRIVARFPFAPAAPGGREALLVGFLEPEASGQDHSFVALEVSGGQDPKAALADAGLEGIPVASWSAAADRLLVLTCVPGLETGPLVPGAHLLGAYADPLPPAED